MSDIQEFWFVARTRKDQELSIRDRLKKLDIEHFLPTQKIIRQLKYRRKQVEVPVIRNLIFLRATKERACELPNEEGIRIFYMRDLTTHSLLIVPDKQMADFMFVMDRNPDSLSYDGDMDFEIGEKVQVIKGEFCGVEGELISKANRSYVVIRIPQVVEVRVRVPKSYLKKIK